MKKPQSAFTLLEKAKKQRKEAFDDVFKRGLFSGNLARKHIRENSKSFLELTGEGGMFENKHKRKKR